jgi:hypothetical protein
MNTGWWNIFGFVFKNDREPLKDTISKIQTLWNYSLERV